MHVQPEADGKKRKKAESDQILKRLSRMSPGTVRPTSLHAVYLHCMCMELCVSALTFS